MKEGDWSRTWLTLLMRIRSVGNNGQTQSWFLRIFVSYSNKFLSSVCFIFKIEKLFVYSRKKISISCLHGTNFRRKACPLLICLLPLREVYWSCFQKILRQLSLQKGACKYVNICIYFIKKMGKTEKLSKMKFWLLLKYNDGLARKSYYF